MIISKDLSDGSQSQSAFNDINQLLTSQHAYVDLFTNFYCYHIFKFSL